MPIRLILVVGGPPNSGKSTFSASVARALENQGVDVDTEDLDLWSSTLHFVQGKITREQRDERKKKSVTKEEAKEARRSLRKKSRKHQLVVADAPGTIDDQLRMICEGTTHGIIVCREDMPDEVRRWTDFFTELDIKLVAVVTSKIAGEESIEPNDIIKAIITKLERTPRNSPAIREFAVLLRSKLGI